MSNYEWTDQQEQLLITWAEKSSGYAWLHSKSINHYKYKNLYISIPAAILSYVAGSTSLIISEEEHTNKYRSIFIGFSGIIAGILVNFQEIFKYKELSEQHRISSLRYLSFFRDISTELSLHPKDRQNSINYIKSKKNELEKMLEHSPHFPQKIINDFEEKFKNVKIHKPDVANNLQTIIAFSGGIAAPNENDLEDINDWLKRKRKIVRLENIEITNSNSDSENNDLIEIANSENGSDNEEMNTML